MLMYLPMLISLRQSFACATKLVNGDVSVIFMTCSPFVYTLISPVGCTTTLMIVSCPSGIEMPPLP